MKQEKTTIMKTPYHSLEISKVLELCNTSPTGLSSVDAEFRLSNKGKNELPQKNKKNIIKIICKELFNPIIILLLFATLFSLIVGEYIDALAIFLLILVDIVMGTVQEKKAERIAMSLLNLVKTSVKVLRDNEKTQVDAKTLCVGDIVLLESGDKVPADMRILNCTNLQVDESLLTGESLLAEKITEILPENTSIGDRKNMLFAGSSVMTGRALAVVVGIGTSTEIGEISKNLNKVKSETSPLDLRIKKFSKQITIGISIIALLIFILLYFQGNAFNTIFLFVIAMAVSAIPEGLPLAITMTLTISSNKMGKKNVVVKNLKAVESLGSCTVIASDKTGTLTLNEQTAKIIVLPDKSEFEVSGSGYNDLGEIIPQNDANIAFAERIAKLGILNNEAKLYKHKQEFKSFGDSIDIAFLSLGLKCGAKKDTFETILAIPYESEKKYSAVFYKENAKTYCTAKGSVEKILSLCTNMQVGDSVQKLDVDFILKQHESYARKGFRLIALADGSVEKNFDEENIKGLTFLGFVGFIDPIRQESKSAVESCHKAGIKVLMITGDHPLTAFAIAKEIDIVKDYSEVATADEVHKSFEQGEREFQKFIRTKTVFSRVSPTDKLNIVNAFKKMGEFVATTGDGVNDAPAIKASHIGIAMGSGTDVAKETADMIITDDNFSSIVQGIKEGRTAYSNIRKVSYLLLSEGIAELLFFFISVLCGLPIPLIAIQLLYLNVITNGLQDFALAFEKTEEGIMQETPRSTKESLFSKSLLLESLVSGLTIGLTVFGVWYYMIEILNADLVYARSVIMALMIFLQNYHTFNCRSETKSIFSIKFFANPIVFISVSCAIVFQILLMEIPFLSSLLSLTSVSYTLLLGLLALGVIILIVMEIYKFIVRYYRQKHHITKSY